LPSGITLFAIALLCSLYSAAITTMLSDVARPVVTIYSVGFALAVAGATAGAFYLARKVPSP
jgi:hypothetical protein